jgi:hypothetical protein
MRQLAAPTHAYLTRMIAAAAGLSLLGAAVMVATRPMAEPQEAVAPVVITETVTVPMSVPVVMAQEPPPAALTKQIALVFRAGGATYMKLASITGDAMPKHGKVKLSSEDWIESAVATVQSGNVPAAHRSWLGKTVTVDGACTAKVVGFAVVSRLVGDPGYAGIEEETWDGATAMDQGAKVIAARLDNCAGGTFARDAALAPVMVPEVIENAVLVASARKALLRSDDATAAQTEWTESRQAGNWYEDAGTETTAQVLRHPKTGETWVSVHLYYGGGCGLPNISVWGLYRADASGKLTRTKTNLGELTKLEKLVDVDGDGELEVIGRPWLGTERTVQTATGATVQDLVLPFYSCPC